MQRGDIYLANFPFGDTAAMKLRPVLLLTGLVGVGTEVVVAYITSVIPVPLLATDIQLDPAQVENQSTGLQTVSVLRLHKLATIHRTSLQRYLGRISPATQQTADAILRATLSL
jgi:mRNA interferase MazF